MDVGSVRIASTAPQEIAAALERHGPVERAVIETGRMTPSVALGLRELGVLIVCIDARQRRRFGYRRLHVLLRREGVMINRKRTQRLYQEEGLAVRRRRSRKRAVGTRAPAPVLALPNQRWNLDFVHDQMAFGRRVRVLNIVDDVTRECLRAVPDTSISGRRVVRELAELIAQRGKPGMIVSDNGTELTSNAVLAWCGETGVEWH